MQMFTWTPSQIWLLDMQLVDELHERIPGGQRLAAFDVKFFVAEGRTVFASGNTFCDASFVTTLFAW